MRAIFSSIASSSGRDLARRLEERDIMELTRSNNDHEAVIAKIVDRIALEADSSQPVFPKLLLSSTL
jgi:hypothetical protein